MWEGPAWVCMLDFSSGSLLTFRPSDSGGRRAPAGCGGRTYLRLTCSNQMAVTAFKMLGKGEGFTDWAFLPAAISWLCCWGLPRYELQPASAQSPAPLTKTLESRALATPRGTSSCKARWLRQGTGQHPCLNCEASTAVVCSVEAQASHCRDRDL